MYKEIKLNLRQRVAVSAFATEFVAHVIETDDNLVVIRHDDDSAVIVAKSGEDLRSALLNGINGDAVCGTPKYRDAQIIGEVSLRDIPLPSPLWEDDAALSGHTVMLLEIDISDSTIYPTLWGENWSDMYLTTKESFEALQNCGVINSADRFEDL